MPLLLQPRTPPPLSVLTPSILRRPTTASLLPSLSFSRRRFPIQKRRRSCTMSVYDGSQSQSQSHPPSPSSTKLTDNELRNSLRFSRAFWVNESLIAWNVDSGDRSCFLYASKSASLETVNNSIQGYEVKIKLERSGGALPDDVIKKFPHIRGYEAYRLPPASDVRSLLKCQLAVGIIESNGTYCNATSLQLPGVLDDLFAYTGPLGAVFSSDHISLYLWAPTAQAVRALLFSQPTGGDPLEILKLEEIDKVWTAKGPRHWEGYYYEYEVSVYHPTTLRVEKCFASDPYSCGLSSNARRTLLVNLASESLKPEGWERLAGMKPQILSFSDISIYELHIRDFSANDETVPPDLRGGYEAFTLQESAGMRHLKKLSDAGLTHIHLLPAFQFAGVDDEKANWKSVDFRKLEQLPPDSVEQQAQITAIQDEDGYNWGYNPVIWGVPKGSYASDPNGPCRIIEFRKMIQALNCIGLRVIMDVVYNHLNASGPCDDSSVLDKIVPGYYLRRNSDGLIEHSACGNNTASEHFMVERLIIDDLLHWAVDYKVDGFRFDLMGHLMKHTMTRAKFALSSLSKEADGVDGSSIYIYGEGWDFGEVAKNSRGVNACQLNLCGTGIGSFNDRIRDAVLGGSPFGHPLQQGFVTGLFLQPNAHDYGGADEKLMLAISKDHIQVGMAANLGEYVFVDHEGLVVKGSEVLTYDQTSVAYAICPTEILSKHDQIKLAAESMRPSLIDSANKKCAEINSLIMESNLDDCCDKLPKIIKVNYVSAHDNETLFDVISMKTPMEVSVDARCRLNHLATSLIGLSQGIPFFHCGDELLRSKSLDRDSYNSGDWFNRLDFNFNMNNWGVGLPPREKNERNWPLIQPRLADPSFKPQKSNILAAVDNFLNLLQIRYSSPLFRLRTANAIQERVRFINTGPSAVPGLIVMSIEDGHEGVPGLTQLDPVYSFLVVLFNARPTETEFASTFLKAKALKLHPVQLMSSDEVVKSSAYDAVSGCFTIPARTTSVFVEPRS